MNIDPRRNELVRPPIANVDQAFLVFSAVQPDWSTQLLDRFLVMIEVTSIQPILIVSKWDLLPESQREEVLAQTTYYEKIGYTVFYTSKETGDAASIHELIHQKISVICGQSGVGKSTLLNVIDSNLRLKTDEISTHLGRGKHTTRHVELLPIQGGWIADTPGFSSLEFLDEEPLDLAQAFIEFQRLASSCKFRGCLHLTEPKCAVKQALDDGEILPSRYENYQTFIQEIKERKPRY
jgi:ribosome biogenesis GTPase